MAEWTLRIRIIKGVKWNEPILCTNVTNEKSEMKWTDPLYTCVERQDDDHRFVQIVVPQFLHLYCMPLSDGFHLLKVSNWCIFSLLDSFLVHDVCRPLPLMMIKQPKSAQQSSLFSAVWREIHFTILDECSLKGTVAQFSFSVGFSKSRQRFDRNNPLLVIAND